MEHIGLFGILIDLIVAVWVANYVYQTQRTYNYRFLKPLFQYCVIYTCAVLIGLVILYVNLNLQESLFQEKFSILKDLGFLIVSLFEIGLVYSMFQAYLGFKDRDVSRRFQNWVVLGLTAFVLSYGLKIVLPAESALFRGLDIFHGNVFDNIALFEILFLILILVSGKKETEKNKVKLRRSFGWLFLSRYIVLTFFFILFVIFLTKAGEMVPRAVRYPIALVLVLLISFIPFIWVKFFFRKYAESLLVIVEEKEILDSLFDKYGISKREQDILRQILDGKTNREIEEKLFISYHTVKNHVYNLYQKLGVKNRYELVHFITKFQRE
jgi:DNA-binding CsgD family transcriptional regulator